ncbi:MAG: hypothetical protein DRG69_09690, partial [Deltaproteobacteria bacterium]
MIGSVDPDEVLSFLARAWSEDKKTQIRRGAWFFANIKDKVIFLPSYFEKLRNEDVLNLANIRRWRFYRFSAWHEAQHIRFSPPREELSKRIFDRVELVELKKYGRSNVKESLINTLIDIFEDYRIEKLGLRDYKYEEEKKFAKELGRIAMENALEKFTNEYNIHGTIATGYLLFDAEMPQTIDLDPNFVEALKEVKKRMLKIETVKDLEDAVVECYTLLYEYWPVIASPSLDAQDIRSIGISLVSSGQAQIKDQIPQSIRQEFKEMMKSIKKFNEEMKTLEKFASSFGGEVQTHLGDWNEIYDPVKTYAEILKNQLLKWKVGWVEHLSHVGDDIEPESYLLSRYYDSYEKPKFLIDEELLSQRTNLLILVDMSGSIEPDLILYKQSLAVITSA